MADKVVIVVDGGNVQDVYSSNPDSEVLIVDHDNLRETLNCTDRQKIEDAVTKDLFAIMADYPETP